jgi:hypothetical protein
MHTLLKLCPAAARVVQARLMQSRHVLGVHVMDGLAATVGQQAGAVGAQRVDHGRVEVAGRAEWASSQGR